VVVSTTIASTTALLQASTAVSISAAGINAPESKFKFSGEEAKIGAVVPTT